MSGIGKRFWIVGALLAAAVGSAIWVVLDDGGSSSAHDVVHDPASGPAHPTLPSTPVSADSAAGHRAEGRQVVEGDRAVQLVSSAETESTATDPLDDSYGREAGLYLDSFISEEPDIVGWTTVWQRLASEAVLVEDSVIERGGTVFGEFRIENEGVTVDFEIGSDGYLLKWNDEATSFAHGAVDFSSSITFAVPDGGQLGEMHGAVQLRPREGQGFHREGPVGHLFYTSESSSNARPLTPTFNDDGTYGLTISPYDEDNASDVGNPDAAFDWYLKLKDIEQSAGGSW